MAERCWDLDASTPTTRRSSSASVPSCPRYRSGRLAPDEALVTRIELFHEWRKFPFRDPGLPLELLPARWCGHDAHQLFKEASELLLPAAERAIDSITGTRREEPVQMSASTI